MSQDASRQTSNDSAFSESMDVDEDDDTAVLVDKYLSGEKKFYVYIANEQNEVILPGILTSIDNVQVDVQKQLEEGRKFFPDQQRGKVVPPHEMDIKYVDQEGRTQIHLAVCRGDVDRVKLMLPQHLSNLNKADVFGKTPLHYCLSNEEILRTLLCEDIINVLHPDNEGKTILHHYCSCPVRHCKREVIELIKNKAKNRDIDILSIKDNCAKTPFCYARKQGNYDVLDILTAVDMQMNWEAEDKRVKGQLKDAIFNKNLEVVKQILKDNEHVDHVLCNTLNDNCESTLHYAVSLCKKENTNKDDREELLIILKELLTVVGVRFRGNKDGKTPFHLACHDCDDKMVELLLPYCHDVNHTCNEGKTPLHYAVEKGTRKKVEKLLNHSNINFKAKDKRGKTALDIAKDNESQTIIIAIVERLCKSVKMKMTIANLRTKERKSLKLILDGRKGSFEENWRHLYKQLKKQEVLKLEEHELTAISNDCHLELGKNVVENLCSREVLVDDVLKFAENKETKRGDISSLLQPHRGRKIEELDHDVKKKLRVCIGLISPGHNHYWKELCEELEIPPGTINEIECGSGNVSTSPTERLLDYMITKIDPALSLTDLYKHLTCAGIKNAAKVLVLETMYTIGKCLLK